MFYQVPSEVLKINSDELFNIGSIAITNSMISGMLTLFFVIILVYFSARKIKMGIPGKFQAFVEVIMEALINFFSSVVGGRDLTIKLLPIVGATFFYVLLSNILPLILPAIGAFEIDGKSLFRTHTNDFSTTFGLAIGLILTSHMLSVQKIGLITHIDKYIRIVTVIKQFKKGIGAGILSIIDLFVGVLDLIGEFAKTFSMSLRLFGNMFAGDLLMGIFLSMFAFILPAIWTGMSLFSGVIQAIVFSALVASYCAAAIRE